MNKIILYIIIAITAFTFYSCAGVTVSSGVGYGMYGGPYGYGTWGYSPRVNVGMYGGGYRYYP